MPVWWRAGCRWLTSRGDAGSAVVEFITLAVVLLVPLFYLVMLLARIEAGSYAASMAARESTRAFITAPAASGSVGAHHRARLAANIAFADQGFTNGQVSVRCSRQPCLTPTGTVTVTAAVAVPLPLIPGFMRAVVPLSVPISAEQVESVPRYRGGP